MRKKIIILASSLFLFSCSNLQEDYLKKQDTTAYNGGVKTKNKTLQQENFILNESGAKYLYDLIEMDVNNNSTREYLSTQIFSPMDVYIGETLTIRDLNADTIRIISEPVKKNYTLKIENKTLKFNSLYQGEYVVELYNGNVFLCTIKIQNKLKYTFSEKDNYDIIVQSYNDKNLDLLLKSSQLYLMAFPANSKQKDVAFMLLKSNFSPEKKSLIKNKIDYLQTNFHLNEYEKIELLKIENSYDGGILTIDNYYLDYNKDEVQLNREIMKIIQRKNRASSEELEFLEQFYTDSQDSNLAAVIGMFYLKNGNLEKGDYYKSISGVDFDSFDFKQESEVETSKTEVIPSEIPVQTTQTSYMKNGINALDRKSYNEALIYFNKSESSDERNFYRGKTYFYLNDYTNTISDLSAVSNPGENTSEIYYYLGVSYHKKNEFSKSKEYLRKSREFDPSSTWGRKSSIYLLKL